MLQDISPPQKVKRPIRALDSVVTQAYKPDVNRIRCLIWNIERRGSTAIPSSRPSHHVPVAPPLVMNLLPPSLAADRLDAEVQEADRDSRSPCCPPSGGALDWHGDLIRRST